MGLKKKLCLLKERVVDSERSLLVSISAPESLRSFIFGLFDVIAIPFSAHCGFLPFLCTIPSLYSPVKTKDHSLKWEQF